MKNVQVIDRALNASYSVFQMTAEEFRQVFPAPGQDLEFAEDLFDRLGDEAAEALLGSVWARPVRKADIVGLHGTLYYGFADRRHHYPESKCEQDFDASALNEHQRRLYGR